MSTHARGARHDGLPCKPTGLADGLGLGSVLRPKGRFAPVKAVVDRLLWFPRACEWRKLRQHQGYAHLCRLSTSGIWGSA